MTAPAHTPAHSAGFTLLEMLIVLVIAGLVIALAGPRILNRLDAVRGRMELKDVVAQLEQLPRRVQLAGRTVELPGDALDKPWSDGLPLLALPADWSLKVEPPLIIGANGLCSAAVISVLSGAEVPTELGRYRVEAATCKLAQDEQP